MPYSVSGILQLISIHSCYATLSGAYDIIEGGVKLPINPFRGRIRYDVYDMFATCDVCLSNEMCCAM